MLYNSGTKSYTSWTVKEFASDILKKYGKGGLLLDCGCSSGEFLKKAETLGYKPIGLDIKNDLKYDYPFLKVDLNKEIIKTDQKFDVLSAFCVVPHLENPYHFFREAHRILKPNGYFIFSTVNVSSHGHRQYFLKHGDLPGYHEKNNHIFILTPALMKKALLSDFELIAKEYLLHPGIFEGFRGRLRSLAIKFFPDLRIRWTAKVVYILRKIKK